MPYSSHVPTDTPTDAPIEIPIAHIDDAAAVDRLLHALRALHGATYHFAVDRWEGETRLTTDAGCTAYYFLIDTDGAAAHLHQGDAVRGPDPAGPYAPRDAAWAAATANHAEALWPGDVITVDGPDAPLTVTGRGVYFRVTTETTGYRAPRLAMLRHLPDHPGGCAAYPGAFRREALPPQRAAPGAADQRGVNRVNEHTLDMRMDRTPTPIRHYHGPVPTGDGVKVNHSETAIVLPRSVYGLPEVDRPDRGHLVLHVDPANDPAETRVVPVRPGSIVVTPATPQHAVGHCFENVFAMLVAIPGFVSPYNFIAEPKPDPERG
jgi:hypothetical protein